MTKPLIKGSTEISGESLAYLLDINPDDYQKLALSEKKQDNSLFSDSEEGIAVRNIFSLEKIVGFPAGTRKVSHGKYISGEVWRDNHYNQVYLYIGKLSNNEDVVLNLKGLAGDVATVYTGYINSGKDKIFFDERIFQRR